MHEQRFGEARYTSKTLELHTGTPRPQLQGTWIPAMGIGWPRILTIGHADACAAFMRTALSALPFHVDITALQDLATARTRLARWHYDLVTLLLPLPEADATISCQNLRAVSQRVHILVLDPKGEPGCEVATLAAGANSYLLGPLHPDDLCAYLVLLLWHQTDAVAQSQPA